jgi:uncharacterized protein YecE (DUF72 family)
MPTLLLPTRIGIFPMATRAKQASQSHASQSQAFKSKSDTAMASSGTSRPVKRPSPRIFVGTSGWSYPSWKPVFYPQEIPARKFLDYYATQLNSVEVNYTFSRTPAQSTIDSWLAAAGPGFRFSFKAPQRITHFRRLKNCAEQVAALAQTLASVAAAGSMGVVLFQLPPNFKADVPRLDAFLADAAPTGMPMAFEFRHPSWFSAETFATLQRHGVALCVAESDDLKTPDIVTAPFACYRFRKSSYSGTQLTAIGKMLRKRAPAGEVFAYFKHEEQPTGALAAVATLRKVSKN